MRNEFLNKSDLGKLADNTQEVNVRINDLRLFTGSLLHNSPQNGQQSFQVIDNLDGTLLTFEHSQVSSVVCIDDNIYIFVVQEG